MINRFAPLINGTKHILLSRFRIQSLNIHPSAHIGKRCVIKRGSIISANNFLEENVELYRHVVLGKNVRVGAFTSINDSTVIECGSIGRFCSIGVDVIIGLGVHPLNHITTSTLAGRSLSISDDDKLKNTPPRSPIIEDDVWIGSRALIMQGVTIHTGAVVGAGAIVTKDVPAYAIVAGVPAKVLRYRFDEETIDRLLKSRIWQNYNDNKELVKQLIEAGEGFSKVLMKTDYIKGC